MSTLFNFAGLHDVDRSAAVTEYQHNLMASVFADGTEGTYLVVTRNSVYVLTVKGTNAEGYTVADVVVPAHPISNASGGLLVDVVPRFLSGNLVVVDDEDVRRTLLRTSEVIGFHHVA